MAMADNSGTFILVLRKGNCIAFVNLRVSELSGFSGEELFWDGGTEIFQSDVLEKIYGVCLVPSVDKNVT